MSNLLAAAKKYITLGFSVIATDANKRSIFKWTHYQKEKITQDALATMFASHKTAGIAIICGAISGNLEVVDVDCKYDLSGRLFEEFMQAIVDALPDLAHRLVIATTKSGGYHIMYRCSALQGNLKLARRGATDEELIQEPHDKVRVLIETRGEGGYVIAAPTDGYAYSQNTIRDLPEITSEQRETIFEIARSFNQLMEPVSHQHKFVEQKTYSKSPFRDYNERGDVVGLLQAHGWQVVRTTERQTIFKRPGNSTSKTSGDYDHDKGFFAVFTTSSIFEPMKGYRPCAVYAMLECNGDYKEAAKKLLAMGYGEPYKPVAKAVKKFIKKNKQLGITNEDLQVGLSKTFNISFQDAGEDILAYEAEEQAAAGEFWHWNSIDEKLSIIYIRFVKFLQQQGFGLYFYDKSSPIFKIIHNDANRLEEATSEKIKKFIQHYLEGYDFDGLEYTQEQLLEIIYKSEKLFGEKLFEFLQPVTLDFLRDTKDTCYFPFRNGIVEITQGEFKLRSYGEMNKVIWKSDIINHHIDIDLSDDFECEFSDFIGKVCGNDQDRILNACSILGYMLHKYKHPAFPHAVVFGEETEDESKGGGTGKGILVRALTEMMSAEIIDGKNFKIDKSFAFQRVGLDTKLIVIQDIEKNFDFKKFYSIITEGITIEKKNKDELYIPYEDSPKLSITTNYTINDEGNHAKRRLKIMEFSGYFHPGHSPQDEYGHLLFNDWDSDEWNRFYNFMFYCVRLYLMKGIIDLDQGGKYRRKKIKGQFGEEFMEWFDDYSSNGCANWNEFSAKYNDFLGSNDLDKKDYSIKRFKKGLQVAADNFSFKLEQRRNRQNNNRYELRLIKTT
ncbi:hypothetical protein DCC81_24645 [Chitinophaga parva]|uniref:DNA primase/polymerase bifunctional N-terminal domain-containing protein n=1 Tax=Chitinophaga parva TaxID=2169414 RepID=A0A2T7BBL8_9BACT|nr:bifunctional DNA primase/polymerase [Chitinophaga parva]PUZ21780.1 hypothetical protein DCC81_24645 [Chitinophaga parva]